MGFLFGTAVVATGGGESSLYRTESMFYLFRRDERDATWRVLKIDRTEPTSLAVVDVRTRYTDGERDELLWRSHAGGCVAGGLNFVTKCYGIIGFVKFLGPYYMVLITRTKEVGVICGHAVYAVYRP